MKSDAFLIGDKIYLRALKKEDIQGNYLRWLNDSEVCKANTHHRFPMTAEDIASYISRTHRNYTQLVFAIISLDTDEHIGNVAINDIHPIDRTGEFAIIIGEKNYWGQGVGKEAASLIINHAFIQFNLNRIHCGTYAHNIGMQRIAESLGMIKEGYRRQAEYKEGQYVDVIEYGLLASEWNKF